MNLKMHLKENGLTVGELTMTIAALIIAGLIWTTLTKEETSKDISQASNSYSLEKSIEDISNDII